MNSVPNKSDYRVKLSDFYDELINQIDVFVETNVIINLKKFKSSFIESSLIKQRDEAIVALNDDRNNSLLRLEQLYDSKEKEANDDIFLISDKELHNNTTLFVVLDPRFLQLGIIKLVDTWLTEHQVDLFKCLFLQDPPDTGYAKERDEDEIQAYMDLFCANYKHSSGGMLTIDKTDFDDFLHTIVFQSSQIVEVNAQDLFRIKLIDFDKAEGVDNQPLVIRPEASFLFEYAEKIILTFYARNLFDAAFINTVLASFNFKRWPKIDIFYWSGGVEDNLQDKGYFARFSGQEINHISLQLRTSLIQNKFFFGLDQLHTLQLINDSLLYRFDPEILQYLTNLKVLSLNFVEVDLSGESFLASNLLEELSFVTCRILNDHINPGVFASLKSLKKLSFKRSATKDGTSYSDVFGSLVHNDLQSLEIGDYGLHKMDESMFTGLPNLTELCLESCGLKTTCSLFNPTKLEFLSLSKNLALSELKYLASTSKLVRLNLSKTCVISLAFLLNLNLINLKELTLDNNNLNSNVVVDLSKMTSLESIDLDKCGLTRIPFKGSLPSLKKLVLSNNMLKEINHDVFACVVVLNLIHLDISSNPIEVVDTGALASMAKLERLVLEPILLGISESIHEWPSETAPILNGLASLKVISEVPEKYAQVGIVKFNFYVACLTKYVWVWLKIK